ncbi:MAG: capsule biosynthesis protein [Paracoccaceae bacterium]
MTDPAARCFLFLQGPHGPFFHRLGRMVERTGARVLRVGFNAGDRAFWFTPSTYRAYTGAAADWGDAFDALVTENGVTDVVLYGDTRAIHATAIARARDRGLRIHVFEEGYMRPYWITYERGGSNGNSRLMRLGIADMRRALERSDLDVPEPPARWGDMRQHMFYGALYHWFVIARNGAYAGYRRHRDGSLAAETLLYTRRLLLMPVLSAGRALATTRIRLGGFPYHLALLQLEHDSSFREHSPYAEMEEFLTEVIEGFAEGAPRHHHLVFKAHPLESGQKPLRRVIARLATLHGIAERIHYVRGGKLAGLLDHARTAVTVNSTAGQQVLWRGIPLRLFGRAVYGKPELVSDQSVAEFYARPARPDMRAYKDYRRFLLETSQVAGGFYSSRGRRALMRHVVDMMLSDEDPYDALRSGSAAPRQPLRAVG